VTQSLPAKFAMIFAFLAIAGLDGRIYVHTKLHPFLLDGCDHGWEKVKLVRMESLKTGKESANSNDAKLISIGDLLCDRLPGG
jgi:hypothetical protein